MAKTKIIEVLSEEGGSSLPAAFSTEQFREDVTNVFLHYVRNIAWMTDSSTAWAITKASPSQDTNNVFDPDQNAADLGLRHESIRDTEFALAMERMYEYAYFGKLDLSADGLEDETIHTWTSALVCDVQNSLVAAEWNAFGLDILSSAKRCAQVAETANARVVLEGNWPFFGEFQSPGKENLEFNFLTARQMALLSGMEEMSIRAAANPSRPNQLKPAETAPGTRATRFSIDVAKEWLKLKKRYVPITKCWSAGELDLAQKRFANFFEMDMGLSARYKSLANEHGRDSIDEKLKSIGVATQSGIQGPFIDITESDYANNDKIQGIAKALDLPESLLVLRVKEVLALEQLRTIERQIRELNAK